MYRFDTSVTRYVPRVKVLLAADRDYYKIPDRSGIY